MSTVVPISDIIKVTVQAALSGAANLIVNSIAIFTAEVPSSSFGTAGFKAYTTPDAVAIDFGSASKTYNQAVFAFAQTPNVLTAGGYIVVIPLLVNGSATAGTMQTLAPGTDFAGFKAISNGSFVLAVDGTPANYTALDFSAVTDMAGVAAIIDTALTAVADCAWVPSANAGAGAFLITSHTTGATSAISKLSAYTSGTDISNSGYLNGTGNVTIINGTAAAGTEEIVAAMVRLANDVFYVGILSNVTLTQAQLDSIGIYAAANSKIMAYGWHDSGTWEAMADHFASESLSSLIFLPYFYGVQNDANNYAAAFLGLEFGTDFSGVNTMATMHLKTLVGVAADAAASDPSVLYDADQDGVNLYVSFAGTPGVRAPKTAPLGFIDQLFGRIWLKLALQIAGFNYLKTTNTKIPQTESGMSGLKGAYGQVLSQGVRSGYLASGLTWTSPTTFGNPADLQRNITDVGFYIYSQPVATQNPTDRANRIAPLVQVAAKEAGAFDRSNVIVSVN